MKKILLIAFTLIFCACSNSDDSNTNDIDKLIGIWKPYREVEVYTNGEEDIYFPSVCELKNRFTFREDRTFFNTNYPESDDPNCEELVGGLYQSGTWEKLSEMKYKLVFNCLVPDCDSYTENLDEVTFPNINLVKIKFYEDDSDDNLDYYFIELSRVE